MVRLLFEGGREGGREREGGGGEGEGRGREGGREGGEGGKKAYHFSISSREHKLRWGYVRGVKSGGCGR